MSSYEMNDKIIELVETEHLYFTGQYKQCYNISSEPKLSGKSDQITSNHTRLFLLFACWLFMVNNARCEKQTPSYCAIASITQSLQPNIERIVYFIIN